MLRLYFLIAVMICGAAFVGCDMPEQKRPAVTPGGIDIDTGGAEPVAQNQTESGSESTESQSAGTQPAEETPQPNVARKTAAVGDGAQGHYERFGRMSIFDHSIGTMYRTKERLTYNVQIPHAMDLYKATNGHFPRTYEEFKREILDPNNIKLPELREGCRYEYNSEKAELEVVYPID
jgi:hypothetical protein